MLQDRADVDVKELIRSTDRQRAEYIRIHFGCNWSDPHLYHMLVSSELGDEEAASMIVEAIVRGSSRPLVGR